MPRNGAIVLSMAKRKREVVGSTSSAKRSGDSPEGSRDKKRRKLSSSPSVDPVSFVLTGELFTEFHFRRVHVLNL